ncbi:MAG: PDZ domain-containing protein [Abditibacteriota bacterium]|nr:PDZ domain-containing protein [Abditibacteriota bacterium]
MKRFLFVLTLILCCGAVFASSLPKGVAAGREALVRIKVISSECEQGREVKSESFGSGVIIDSRGYAVTNHHVAGNALELYVTLTDSTVVPASLVGTDPLADIAVIKLPDGRVYPTARIGDSSAVKVGDTVYAMGSPLALSQSVTKGIVSNTAMMFPEEFGDYMTLTLDGEEVGTLVRWIGHDAFIDHGSSGGPLVNKKGEVVGINEIGLALGGAIPSNLAFKVAKSIIATGDVERAWIGLDVQPRLATQADMKGALVSGVLPDSPAAKAGFAAGDIILSVDGRPVDIAFREQVPLFNGFIADLSIGKEHAAVVSRGGEEKTISFTPVQRERAVSVPREITKLGITCSDITYMSQKQMGLESRDGVIVTGVLPGGPVGMAKPGPGENAVITSLGGEKAVNRAKLKEIAEKLDGMALLEYTKDGKKQMAAINLAERTATSGGTEARKPWIGIETQIMTKDLDKALGIDSRGGLLVTRIYPGTKASECGLEVGDVIVAFNNVLIEAENPGDERILSDSVRRMAPGTVVTLAIIRDGKEAEVRVESELAPRPAKEYPKYISKLFEFTARNIAFSDVNKPGSGAESGEGVIVESVTTGGRAALAGLKAGDVITEVDGNKIGTVKDLEKYLGMTGKNVFKIRRGVRTMFTEFK